MCHGWCESMFVKTSLYIPGPFNKPNPRGPAVSRRRLSRDQHIGAYASLARLTCVISNIAGQIGLASQRVLDNELESSTLTLVTWETSRVSPWTLSYWNARQPEGCRWALLWECSVRRFGRDACMAPSGGNEPRKTGGAPIRASPPLLD